MKLSDTVKLLILKNLTVLVESEATPYFEGVYLDYSRSLLRSMGRTARKSAPIPRKPQKKAS